MLRRASLHTWLAVGAALALVAAGCGSDESSEATTASPPGSSAVTTAPTAPETITPGTDAPATTTAPETSATPTAAPTTAAPTTAAPTTAAPTTAPAATIDALIYGIRDERLVALGRRVTDLTPAAVMAALVAGLTPDETAAGIVTMVPADTVVHGAVVDGTEVTVDVSSAFASGGGSLAITARVAQTVFTLTQFPGIETVRIAIDGVVVTDESGGLTGEGVLVDHTGRLDWDGFIPLILMEEPVDGATVTDPIHVRGVSNTFEAVINYQVLAPDGALLVESYLMATSGTGTWGTFDSDLQRLPEGTTGQVIVRLFEYSAKDGTPVNITEATVTLA